MTTKITVSVNGNYKIPVKQGDTVTWVSGRPADGVYVGPVTQDFHPHGHGDGTVFVIGPEEPDVAPVEETEPGQPDDEGE